VTRGGAGGDDNLPIAVAPLASLLPSLLAHTVAAVSFSSFVLWISHQQWRIMSAFDIGRQYLWWHCSCIPW
jgi:hypothetical protein